MCGGAGARPSAAPPEKEVRYLDEPRSVAFTRKRDLPAGHVHLTADDIYLAVPLQQGQISGREFAGGERLKAPMIRDAPVKLRDIDAPYAI